MEEAKRKEIEAKWYQLISQSDPAGTEKTGEKRKTRGAKIIRRRKGREDVRVM